VETKLRKLSIKKQARLSFGVGIAVILGKVGRRGNRSGEIREI